MARKSPPPPKKRPVGEVPGRSYGNKLKKYKAKPKPPKLIARPHKQAGKKKMKKLWGKDWKPAKKKTTTRKRTTRKRTTRKTTTRKRKK